MKKCVVVVMIVLVFSSYIFAGSQSQSQSQNQEQNQEQSQGQDQSQTQDSSAIIEEKIQGILPSMPEHLLIPPRAEEVFFWNKYGVPKKSLEGIWTREKAQRVRKTIGWKQSLIWPFGPRIKVVVIDSGFPKTDELEVKINVSLDSNDLKNYIQMDPINATATKGVTQYQLFGGEAVYAALNNGADLVVLFEGSDGLNTAINSKTLGLPVSIVSVAKGSAFTGAIGLGEAVIKKVGEPGIVLVPFVLKSRVEKTESKEIGKEGEFEVVVEVLNSDGSVIPVILRTRKNGVGLIGPRGDYYRYLPMAEELESYRLF